MNFLKYITSDIKGGNYMNKKLIIIITVLLLALIAVIIVNNLKGREVADVENYFTATVLENKRTSIMVQPDEGQSELNSSDKIVVRVAIDGAVLDDLSEFVVGSKVKITYGGEIMESYPAQINAYRVEFAE